MGESGSCGRNSLPFPHLFPMPRKSLLATRPDHDPALVTVFGRSRKSYERNRDELLARLEAAAQRTRQAAPAHSPGRGIPTKIAPAKAAPLTKARTTV